MNLSSHLKSIFICMAGFVFLSSIEASPQANNCKLTVAWTPRPPYMESTNPPAGTQLELLSWIAKDIGCKLEFRQSIWSESLAAVKNGGIDLVGRASYTPQRSKFAYFSDPYMESLLVLYVRKGSNKLLKGQSLEALLKQGFIIGLVEDAYYGETIESLKNRKEFAKNFVYFGSTEGAQFKPIIDNLVDGIFEAPFAMDNLILKSNLNVDVEEYPVELIVENFRFMFSKKRVSKDLVDRFNQSLRKIKQSEQYQSHWYWSTIK